MMGVLSPTRSRLKRRLREFWDAQTVYWNMLTDEESVKPGLRARAASFIPAGAKILDIACGGAANSPWLSQRGEYFGTDLSRAGLLLAHKKGLFVCCADAEWLPFADGCFDAAISTYALEHSVDPAKMLDEMHRVVRPGGTMVLLGPTWDLPFWYPNAVRSRARSVLWRCRYTLQRFVGQLTGYFFGWLPFVIIEEPDALSQPFTYDSDAVYVVWSYEVIRQMENGGCRLVHFEVDDRLLGSSMLVQDFKRLLMLLPMYRFAGSTSLMVFKR